MRRVSILLTIVLAAVMAGQATAQQMDQQKEERIIIRRGMMGMGQGMMMDEERMGPGGMVGFFLNQAEELGLSDEQVAKLRSIRTETQKALIRKQADLRVAQIELEELLQNPTAKRADLEAKAKEVQRLQSEVWLTAFRARLDAREVLTSEQLKKAASLRRMGMHKEMMERRMHREGMMEQEMMRRKP